MKNKKQYRVYAAAYQKSLHILFDPLPALGGVITQCLTANGGELLHAGKTIVGKCHERFYLMKTAATARKLAKIMTNSYEVTV